MQFLAAHSGPCLGNVSLAASGLLLILSLGSPQARAEQPFPPVPVHQSTDCSEETAAAAKADLALAYSLENKGQVEQALRVLNHDTRALAGCSLQARVYTQIGRLQLQLGDCKAAGNASQEALRLHDLTRALTCEEVGLDYFIIADSRAGIGDFSEAESAYKQAAHVLETCGPKPDILLPRVYSNLALVYVNLRNLDLAEQSIEKSLALEKNRAKPDRIEEILDRQTLADVEYRRGRISEALKALKDLVTRYGTDEALTPALRASLYEDYGELCRQQARLAEAAESLKLSATLKIKCPGRTGIAKTLARLAWVRTLQRQFDQAEDLLKDAEIQLSASVEKDPLEVATVAAIYGACLNARQRWNDARTKLLDALAFGNSKPAFAEIQLAALLQLAEADHHLHLKQEEKKSREQARLLQASAVSSTASQVVDVISLEHSYSP